MVEMRVSRTTPSAPVADRLMPSGLGGRGHGGGRAVPVPAHREHVAEVGVHFEGEVQRDRVRRAVQDADPLPQAAIDEAGAPDREGLAWQRAAGRQGHGVVDQLDGGHVRLAIAGREEQRRLPVERQLESRQEADVVEVEAEAGVGRCHGAVLGRDDHDVALLEGDRGDGGAAHRRGHAPSPYQRPAPDGRRPAVPAPRCFSLVPRRPAAPRPSGVPRPAPGARQGAP